MKQFEKLTEREIIERILDDKKPLYEIIVRRFNPYLYKIGRSYNFNHDDTQDLMQETFIDAYRNLSHFEGRSSFKTWISRIMLNNCYKKMEKLSFKKEVMRDVNEKSEPLFSTASNDTGRVIHSRELRNIIETALHDIPEDYRMVFSLREINGMNVAETAELLGITEANVKVRLNRSKNMLQEIIKKSYAPKELYEYHAVYCDAMTKRVMDVVVNL